MGWVGSKSGRKRKYRPLNLSCDSPEGKQKRKEILEGKARTKNLEAEIKRLTDGIASLLTQVNETIADGGETIILVSVRDGLKRLVGRG